MLFNSYSFLLLFLPLTYGLFQIIKQQGNNKSVLLFLFVASLFFYGCWNSDYLPLLLLSILFNYFISRLMCKLNKKHVLIFGILINLLVLIYFKYIEFIIFNVNFVCNLSLPSVHYDLPLGISFFTFTQIAYLVDRYRNEIQASPFVNYGLFVTFFPHLMAGPILHHQEIMPQFKNHCFNFSKWDNLAIGLTIFAIGLAKKTLIADSLSPYVSPVFMGAAQGGLTFIDAWCGSLAYTFQLYFDFSGYSDMAIGLARLFGIIFPLNFNSPYKSTSIIDFWRRWHITLSRFLRDYLYIPLGGNRKGKTRTYINLFLTMLLGGLWHGAAWTFIVWGMLHGVYLLINHAWRALKIQLFDLPYPQSVIYRFFAQTLTFIAVVIGWVFFRADSFSASNHLLRAMFNIKRINFNSTIYLHEELNLLIIYLIVAGIIVFIAPNTQQILYQHKPAIETYQGEIKPYKIKFFQWNPGAVTALWYGTITVASLLTFGHVSEFLYYKF